MTKRTAPVPRASLTPFTTPLEHCPWCKSDLLPLAATETASAGAYCPRCPWQSRSAANAQYRKPRKPENLRPAIRASSHLEQRQRERNRWRETEPVDDRDRPVTHAEESGKWTTTDRVLMGAAALFIAAAIAVKHWPL